MWISARELADHVQNFGDFDDPAAVDGLLTTLGKYQTRLQLITKNSDKSQDKVSKLPDGNVEVIINNQRIQVTGKMWDEAAIIANLFRMSQKDAIELVLTADLQVHNFEGLSRGLTAVVCYYDAHRLFALTLKRILNWNKDELPQKLKNFIMEHFVKLDVLKHLIDHLLKTFTVAGEFHPLVQEGVHGLAGPYHQSLLRSSIEETRILASECAYEICRWTTKKQDFLAYIFKSLQAITSKAKIQSYQVVTWTCFAIMLDSRCLLESNDEAAILRHCNKEVANPGIWQDVVTYGSACLVVGLAIKNLSISPADHSAITELAPDLAETLIDRAIHFQCFHYIGLCLLRHEDFRNVVYQVEAVDNILKEFCILFSAKMTELMRHGIDDLHFVDEVQRNKGLTIPPKFDHFCVLLSSFSELYRSDIRLNTLRPSIDYALNQLSEDFTPDKNLQLCHSFLALAQIDEHSTQTVTFLQTLCDICRNPETAAYIFNMFGKTPMNINYENCNLWSRFINALRSYEKFFRENSLNNTNYGVTAAKNAAEKLASTISQEESAGIIVWCRLVETISKLDDNACQTFCLDRNWTLIEISTSLIKQAIPTAMKGALLRMLAVLARLPPCAEYIWGILDINMICAFGENGQLTGLVKELEERECTKGSYGCSLGMMYLLRALFSHSVIPPTAKPYLEYATTCVLWPLSSRNYESIVQMWELCEVGLDALYFMLSNNHFDARSLEMRDPAAVILLQMLNREAPLYRMISWVLLEDSAMAFLPYRLSRKAALSALKLFNDGISKLEVLRTALRTTENSSLISSMSALLLSPLHQDSTKNLLTIMINYLSNLTDHPLHALMSVFLLRELCSSKPSLQQNIVALLLTEAETLPRLIRAAYLFLDFTVINYTIDDVYLRDSKDFYDNNSFVQGETSRVFLEVLADSIESDPSTANMGYTFLGIDLLNENGLIYNDASQKTGMHRLISFIGLFCSTEDPLSLPASAIFQPLFRLLRGLVSVKSPISPAVLRFLRTHEAIYSLATSPFLGLHAASLKDDSTSTKAAISDLIAGDILHLIALEFSSLMLQDHLTDPQKLLRVLLENLNGGAEVDANETAYSKLPEDKNVLFAILSGASHALPIEEQPPINLAYFDASKLKTLLENCVRGSVWGAPVYDVEYLHFLLRREIRALALDDPFSPKQEMEQILAWTTTANAYELLSNAHSSLISGCSAMINVIALFTPLPFFTIEAQIDILSDACFELVIVASTHDGELGDELAVSISRVCKAICKLLQRLDLEKTQKRDLIEKLLSPIFELMVQPGSKTLQSKMSLYLAAQVLVSSCYTPPVNEIVKEKAFALGDVSWLYEPLKIRDDPIRLRMDSLTQELATLIIGDVSDFPDDMKFSPLSLLATLIWEDTLGSRRISTMIIELGLTRILLHQLKHVNIDYAKLMQNRSTELQNFRLFRTILGVLTRLCFMEAGWASIAELGTLKVLRELPYLTNPPKEVFLQPASLKNVRSASWYYGEVLTSVMYLVSAMFSQPQWKKLSKSVIEFITDHAEVFGQLCRADLSFTALDLASGILDFIDQNDDVLLKDMINASQALRMILAKAKDKAQPPPKAISF